ncbi:MAG: hypothetical protein JNN18_11835 [Rubrivivax sp.]|jgi:predicted butyrate kinase (DUF1464 family)|nr:hypothetical protein [Rubrivivax sp.]
MASPTVSPKEFSELRKEHDALHKRYETLVKDLNASLVNAKAYVDEVGGRVASVERKYDDLLKVVAKRAG